ncbi:HIG1 domain family member 1A, mitochondrial-like [Periplaneta americana]|uniref:HIG1 domain family member 1A, mitochondrial-like n=1 Tax=Periplaneta americana TaxID=6978 RepID=UPI0037E9B8F0
MPKEFEGSSNMVTESAALPTFSEESHSSRLARKTKEAPLFPIGIAGLTLACLYGIYKYKHRGNMSTSVFLMQLRVGAQGTVVACLTAGIGYSLLKQYVFKSDDDTIKKD